MKIKSLLLFVFVSSLAFSACHFIDSFNDDEDDVDVRSVAFDKNAMEISVGSMDILNLSIDSSAVQGKLSVEWSYDASVISGSTDSYGIVITALQEGTTTIRAKCGGMTASCALRVISEEDESKGINPYVYCSEDFVGVNPGETKKVFASLYGGKNADLDGFSFSSDKPSVASLYTEGNYCWITGMNEGLAKITARHTKSSFSYSFLVSCSASCVDVPYITTSSDILTINRSEKTGVSFTVDLKNPLYTTYADDFSYSVCDRNGNEISNPPVSLSFSGKKCSVEALESGICIIKITHPSASYSLEVLCRIVEEIDSAYIQASSSFLIVNGKTSETLDFSLQGITDGALVDNDKFEWSFSENAENFIDYDITGGSESGKGNSIWITGKKNGSVKITVSHPLSSNSRTVLVTVRNTETDATSSKIYITTSQNYLELYEGNDETELSISVNNLSGGEENLLEWYIENDAADGSKEDVIAFSGCTGKSFSTSRNAARSLISSVSGKAYIAPLKEGEAVITITHPKASYPVKILVKVLKQKAEKTVPLSVSTATPFIAIKNGETEELNVSLSNAKDGDETSLAYSTEASGFTLSPNGTKCYITACGSGVQKGKIIVSHPDAPYPLSVAVASYDTDEELSSLKSIYSDSTVCTVLTGERTVINVTGTGLSQSDHITWTVRKGLNDTVYFSEQGFYAEIEGIKKGTAEIAASLDGADDEVVFYVNVKQNGIIDDEKPVYLSTFQNVVTLDVNSTADVSVSPMNMLSSEYRNIEWKNSSPEIFSISSNGNTATITPKSEGSGRVTVSHALSSNELEIIIHIGNEYSYQNTDFAYISTEKDTVLLKTDSEAEMFSAVLAHTESDLLETSGFDFSSSDTSIFTVNYSSSSNYCIISPKKAGQAVLTITHSEAEYAKEVIVVVEKSAAELSDIAYISTSQNVVTVVQGEYTSVSAILNNSTDYEASKWTWTSINGSISDIVTNNGNTAMISGVSSGTTKIEVSHSSCVYPLEIIVICLDADIVSANPFIQTDTNIITIKKNGSRTLSAQMKGGADADSSAFIWTVSDSSIALINGTGGACYVKGLKSGTTYITVRNTNYPGSYAKTVLVRVEDTTDDECYIKVSESILKMNPKDTAGKNITATLENGAVLDAQDFVWWVDDYNIVKLISITDTASVVPTGVSGTTYVHVKHPKVLNSFDILVVVSEYDEFAFSSLSANILEKSINFVNMQVPAFSSDMWIEYETSNSDICVATGSSKVCMLAGIKKGSAQIKAILKNSNGTVGETELAVIVGEKSENLNTISMNSTILNMNIGDSQTLETILSGADIKSTDVHEITWEVDENASDEGVVSLLATEQNVTKGRNAYITAKKPGTAILKISHPKCLYPLTVWVIVPEKEIATVSLSQTYIEMYKSDGSVTVTAKIANGTSSDENEITWTAPKVGGLNIISVSKSKGKTCNIVPRNIGSTTLRAQLPNGNYADCVVTVLTNAQIVLETNSVHVNPGFSETVRYSLTPENVNIDWQEMMNGSQSLGAEADYFDFNVNTATKTITITGKEIGSGYIYGYFASDNGTASAKLDVKCEYIYELEFENKGVVRTMPKNGTVVELPFHVYPKNLEIKATGDCDYLEVSSYSIDEQTGKGVVYVKPLTEGVEGKIKLTATNPKDLVNTPIETYARVDSYYDEIHINPVFNFASGSFSTYSDSGQTLELGDGEDVTFYLAVQEENAKIKNIELTYADNSDSCDSRVRESGEETKEDSNHIFFSGSDKDGKTFSQESTTADGLPIYRIGHDWDYVDNDAYYVLKHYEYNQGLYIHNGHIEGEKWFDWGFRTKTWITFDLLENPKFSASFNSGTKKGDTDFYNNDITMDIKDLQQRYKSMILNGSAGRVLNCPYVIDKNNFQAIKSYYFPSNYFSSCFPSRWTGTYKVKNSVYKDDSLEPNAPVMHPWYEGRTSTKNTDIRGKASGTITISYERIKGSMPPITVKVRIYKRNCEKNIKDAWETVYVNGIKCYKLVNKSALNDVEAMYNQSTDYYTYANPNTVDVFNGKYEDIVINTNIKNSTIASLSNSDADICSVSIIDSNSIRITGMNGGTATITGTVKSKSDSSISQNFEVSVTVKEKLLLLESVDSLNNGDELKDSKQIPISPAEGKTSSANSEIFSNVENLDFSKISVSKDNSNIEVSHTGNVLTFTSKVKYVEQKNEKGEVVNSYYEVQKGTTNITVSHPDCTNTLVFAVTVN